MSKEADVSQHGPIIRSASGNPTDEELAAIAVAIETVWPRPTVEEEVAETAESVWKFANRWWQGSRVHGRIRPRRRSTFG